MNVDLETLDAFIDGEPVDVTDVKDALSSSDGRDYLVDAWLLRQAMQSEPPVAASASIKARHSGRVWLAAAGIAAALAGGYAAGRLGGTTIPTALPGPNVTPAVASSAFPVPAPTRVIQLEFHAAATTTGGD